MNAALLPLCIGICPYCEDGTESERDNCPECRGTSFVKVSATEHRWHLINLEPDGLALFECWCCRQQCEVELLTRQEVTPA